MTLFCVCVIGLILVQLLKKRRIRSAFLRKHNESVLLIVEIIFFIVLMGGSTDNPDTAVYKNMYAMDFYSKNPGFGYIILFFKNLGVSLDVFRLLIAICGILLINSVVKQYLAPKQQGLFYLLYFIYPYFMDIVQIRNFISMAIAMVAFNILIQRTVKSRIIYILMILLAASFQIVFIVYLPFVIIDIFIDKRRTRQALLLFIIAAIILSGNKFFMNWFASAVGPFLADNVQDIMVYLNQSTHFGGYAHWFISFANVGLLYYEDRYLAKVAQNNGDFETEKFCNSVYILNVYSLIFLPLNLLTLDFYRIQRNIQLLNYIVFIMMFWQTKRKNYRRNDKFFIYLTTLIIVGVSFVSLFVIDNPVNSIMDPIFSNNWILGIKG